MNFPSCGKLNALGRKSIVFNIVYGKNKTLSFKLYFNTLTSFYDAWLSIKLLLKNCQFNLIWYYYSLIVRL